MTCFIYDQKNDKEKAYLQLSTAHTEQQGLLQKLQERQLKVRKLEEACRKQEKVIEKMERLLQQGVKSKGKVCKIVSKLLVVVQYMHLYTDFELN